MTSSGKAPSGYRCWVCGGDGLRLLRASTVGDRLAAADFAITDTHYGRTGAIYRCGTCGFRQCPEMGEVLGFYEQVEDEAYEAGAAGRARQMRALLRIAGRVRPAGRLLDIGAGSGILVGEAVKAGYEAEGIEPSRWLHARAAQKGLRVHWGTLPHANVVPPYDVVTVVDVVEHVSDPVGLLTQAHDALADNGVCIVVTPDVGSLAARLMGRRWWHYRVGHIGYFNRRSLDRALAEAGFQAFWRGRPSWYLPAAYVARRAVQYLPRPLRPRVPAALERITLPVNLRDSLLVCARKTPGRTSSR